MKKSLYGAVLGAGLFLATGGIASAGPPDHAGAPDSNAERGNGLSICTFSGQNDTPDDPEEGGRVQSYGQVVKIVGVAALKEEGETPRDLCNPNNFAENVPFPVWWRETPRTGGGKG